MRTSWQQEEAWQDSRHRRESQKDWQLFVIENKEGEKAGVRRG